MDVDIPESSTERTGEEEDYLERSTNKVKDGTTTVGREMGVFKRQWPTEKWHPIDIQCSPIPQDRLQRGGGGGYASKGGDYVKALHEGPLFIIRQFLSVLKWDAEFKLSQATVTTTVVWGRGLPNKGVQGASDKSNVIVRLANLTSEKRTLMADGSHEKQGSKRRMPLGPIGTRQLANQKVKVVNSIGKENVGPINNEKKNSQSRQMAVYQTKQIQNICLSSVEEQFVRTNGRHDLRGRKRMVKQRWPKYWLGWSKIRKLRN
ncbi:unnamed protein product [Ilex paraguariensis]|uniref:Uncharacterized protein n=1 Tax=Ilex paraguariensis TaxID=185542 RepID=A0ABC8T6R6_9AQUA